MKRKTPLWYYDATSPCETCELKDSCSHVEDQGITCKKFMDEACKNYSYTKESVAKGFFDGLTEDADKLKAIVHAMPVSGLASWDNDPESCTLFDFAMEALLDSIIDEYNRGLVKAANIIYVQMTMQDSSDWGDIRGMIGYLTYSLR